MMPKRFILEVTMLKQRLIQQIRSATTILPAAEQPGMVVVDLSGNGMMATRVEYLIETRDGVREVPIGTPLRVSIDVALAEGLKPQFGAVFGALPASIGALLWPRGLFRKFKRGLSILEFAKLFPDMLTSIQAAALGEYYGLWKITRPTFEDWIIEGVAGDKFVFHLKG